MPKVNQEINLDLLKDSSKEVLVDIVKDYPILWNSNSPEYRNTRFKSKRHAAWKEVASLWRQALRMEQLIERMKSFLAKLDFLSVRYPLCMEEYKRLLLPGCKKDGTRRPEVFNADLETV